MSDGGEEKDFSPEQIRKMKFPRFVVYKYGESYKVVMCSFPVDKKKRSTEDASQKKEEEEDITEEDKKQKQLKLEYERFESSMRRSKDRITELAMCNEWDFFGTITLNPDKFKRNDLEGVSGKLTKYLQNYQRTVGNIDYLIVPELHEDKENWHFHLLIKFSSQKALDSIVTFDLGKAENEKQLKTYMRFNNLGVKNWEYISEKFGYCTFSPVKSRLKVALYIRKYITKDIKDSISKLDTNAKSFYASKGLKEREKLFDGMSQQVDFTEITLKEYDHCMTGLFTLEEVEKIKVYEKGVKHEG